MVQFVLIMNIAATHCRYNVDRTIQAKVEVVVATLAESGLAHRVASRKSLRVVLEASQENMTCLNDVRMVCGDKQVRKKEESEQEEI
jgi:hypothetical protein